ncbi:forespore capture DNA-binding protein RefZ [Neobacillus sp. LXY-4]|uniref:forespore capture DNA-binding protein RefZ n=1 Tax=Neobacillus sp. LXY-4 TaxID=3379826 RepID=UPI003EE41029
MRKNSKEAIVTAAVSLFNANGFDGTSIRDIAKEAKINAANISYYFRNKQGLLEYCLTVFFENYMAELEKGFQSLEHGASQCLKEIAKKLWNYQCNHIQLTRFVLREMSIDSQIVREILTTYYTKERYIFHKVIEKGMDTKEFKATSIQYLIIQFKGLLSSPFLNTQYLTEVLHVFPHERYFADKYLQEINQWVDRIVCIDPAMQSSCMLKTS